MNPYRRQALVGLLSEAYGFKAPTTAFSSPSIEYSDVLGDRHDLGAQVTYRWVTRLELRAAATKINRALSSSDLVSGEHGDSPDLLVRARTGKLTQAEVDDFVDEFMMLVIPNRWAHVPEFWNALIYLMRKLASAPEIATFYEQHVVPAVGRRLGTQAHIGHTNELSVQDLFVLAPEIKRAALKLRAAAPKDKWPKQLPDRIRDAEAAKTWVITDYETKDVPPGTKHSFVGMGGRNLLQVPLPRVNLATIDPAEYRMRPHLLNRSRAAHQQLRDLRRYPPEFVEALQDFNGLVKGDTREAIFKALGVISNFGSGLREGSNRYEQSLELMQELPTQHKVIAGGEHRNAIRRLDVLVRRFGGQPEDWVKISSRFIGKGADTISIHAYMNRRTKEIVNLKTKLGGSGAPNYYDPERIQKFLPGYRFGIGKVEGVEPKDLEPT